MKLSFNLFLKWHVKVIKEIETVQMFPGKFVSCMKETSKVGKLMIWKTISYEFFFQITFPEENK